MKNNIQSYHELLKYLGTRIKTEMKNQNLEQGDIAKNINISQGSVSNIINGKDSVSIKKYLEAMTFLKIDFSTELSLFSHTTNVVTLTDKNYFFDIIPENSENFYCDPKNSVFNGQMGWFNVLFHSTNRNEDACIHGSLHLFSHKNRCMAELEIKTTDTEDTHDNSKIYTGFVVISLVQNAIYVLLARETIGEICFLVYPYQRIMREKFYLQGTMALAVTVSSGIDSRRPTVHRLFLSRKTLDKMEEQYILSQLLLNKAELLISKDKFNELCNTNSLSSEFINCFEKHSIKEIYYRIDDDHFKDLIRQNKSAFYDLCSLRAHSTSPKNNKINDKIISNIFHYILKP